MTLNPELALDPACFKPYTQELAHGLLGKLNQNPEVFHHVRAESFADLYLLNFLGFGCNCEVYDIMICIFEH